MGKEFDYERAFERNIGWLTHFEQQQLRGKRVAIAGLGGVGGHHVQTLARLGVSHFTLADFDRFELANFNRQAGARMSTLGRSKVDVVREMATDINPQIRIRSFDQGIQAEQIASFLHGVDIYIDSLDFFEIELRRRIFKQCADMGIPALTAAPVGMGCAFLYFAPGGMSFEQWFRFEQASPDRWPIHFAAGLTPQAAYRAYMMDLSSVNLTRREVPSTGIACELCAAVTAAQVVKILLQRGPMPPVPTYHLFDPYLCQWTQGHLSAGNGAWRQRIKLALAYRLVDRQNRNVSPRLNPISGTMEKMLDLARWAPSGDNLQPWRFHIEDDQHVTVRLQPVDSFYEQVLDGKGTWLSVGALLETLRIAASRYGRSMTWTLDDAGVQSSLAVRLEPHPDIAVDPLQAYVVARSVQRQPFRTDPLSAAQKARMQQALGDDFDVVWHETRAGRWRASRLNMRSLAIISRLRETYETHRKLFDFERDFSATGIPAKASGASSITRWLMKWVMGSWVRMDFFNRFMGAALLTQLEMALVPGMLCAAHFVIRWRKPDADASTPLSLIRAGQAMQRFWLQATAEGLVLQPSVATLIFALYAGHPCARQPFLRQSQVLGNALQPYAGAELAHIVFMGRMGTPRSRKVTARSLRLPLSELLQ